MDGVTPVQKWSDSSGKLHDSEEAAAQAQARIVVRNLVLSSVDCDRRTVDVELLHDRRNALYDALRKIRKGE
jgi:hypothetical protein